MQFLARAMAFLFGLGFAGICLFALAFRFPHAWMPLALGSFMAALLGYCRWVPGGGFSFAIGTTWLTGAFALWMASSNVRLPIMQVQSLQGLYGFASIAFLITCGLGFALRPAERKTAAWLIWSMVLGLAICYLSGPPGKLDIVRAILERFGAGEASFLVRKLGHFTFYGLIGWVSARGSLAAGNKKRDAVLFALAVVLAVAGYDELRQSTLPMRVGSPIDVLIDLAGALTFLSFTKATKGVRSQ